MTIESAKEMFAELIAQRISWHRPRVRCQPRRGPSAATSTLISNVGTEAGANETLIRIPEAREPSRL